MTVHDVRQQTVDQGHREAVLRTSADIFENAGRQAEALVECWPEYGADIERFLRFQKRVTQAAVAVGHRPKVSR